MNQDCDAYLNQCRLDTYSTDWDNCSQASPCAEGEGDCDDHTDCEGELVCGNDNCASGTTGMDCCMGIYIGMLRWKYEYVYNI